MGVIKELALLPVAPLRFTMWVAGQVADQVEHERSSPEALVRRLQQIEDGRARGDIDDERAAELEAEVLGWASAGWGRGSG